MPALAPADILRIIQGAIAPVVLLSLAAAGLRIVHVPRTVDPQFATRLSLCPNAPMSGGAIRANDAQRSVAEFIGPDLIELQVHQVGDSFPDFGAVARHVRHLLARHPRFVSHFTPWAEATPLGAVGILGTLRYTHGRQGRIEIAGVHMCIQDTAGTVWWIRLAPVDLWSQAPDPRPAGQE